MDNLAVPLHSDSAEDEPRIRLLLADDDASLRLVLAARVRDTAEALELFEAKDGVEAVQVGLQQRPQIALLDVNMPRLGGIEVAITLRELRPQMRVALQTADPRSHRDRARVHGLPLFDKLDLDDAVRWLESQAQACRGMNVARPTLECPSCGYGVVCSRPPERCPMCQGEDGWIQASRPRRRGVERVV
jgi:CheY-like chemotaxis protein